MILLAFAGHRGIDIGDADLVKGALLLPKALEKLLQIPAPPADPLWRQALLFGLVSGLVLNHVRVGTGSDVRLT